jgi:hypothetical protein
MVLAVLLSKIKVFWDVLSHNFEVGGMMLQNTSILTNKHGTIAHAGIFSTVMFHIYFPTY